MRILHINKYYHEQDGVGRYMHDAMRLADERGHATAVLAMHHEKNNPSVWEAFFISNLETKHLGKGTGVVKQFARTVWSYEAYKKTQAIIRAFQPDVIHAHNLYTHLSPSVLSAAHRAGVPVVLTAHDYGYISANYGLFDGHAPISPRASWYTVVKTKCTKGSALATGVVDAVVRTQKMLGMWTRGVTHILTASHTVKHALEEGGYPSARIQVLPLPSGTYARGGEYGKEVRARVPRIVFASRFEAYKGSDVVMHLAERMPDVDFVCIGHGTEEEQLRRCAARVKNLSILPVMSPQELWEYIQHSAGVMVPSRWREPFGLIALEALALGTPAIVSSEGGLSEIVEHGVSGFVEHPDALDAWEKHVRALVPEKGGELTSVQEKRISEARVRAEKIGNPHKHAEQLVEIYTQAIHQNMGL